MYMETDTRPIKWKIFVSFKFQLTMWQPMNGEGINKYFNLKKMYKSNLLRKTRIRFWNNQVHSNKPNNLKVLVNYNFINHNS